MQLFLKHFLTFFIIDFTCLEVAEWNPQLDMQISYHPVVGLGRTVRLTQGMTYRPRHLFTAHSSLMTGDVCYLMYCIVVLIISWACSTVLSLCTLTNVKYSCTSWNMFPRLRRSWTTYLWLALPPIRTCTSLIGLPQCMNYRLNCGVEACKHCLFSHFNWSQPRCLCVTSAASFI